MSVERTLAQTREALRTEIGPPTERDHKWQPMVSAGEVRALLDAVDRIEEVLTEGSFSVGELAEQSSSLVRTDRRAVDVRDIRKVLES